MRSTDIRQDFLKTAKLLERVFRRLEGKIPAPKRMPWKDGFVFRYSEKTPHQAIIQKLARTVSGLYAIVALIDRGLFQEQGVIQRVLDEIEEDVLFLSFGVIRNEITERHKKYLEYFYAEEFEDPEDIYGSHSSRGMIPRAKIRAYVNSIIGDEESRGNAAGKILAKAYSGYVHAASPQIMDMYGGHPPAYDLNGMLGYLRVAGQAEDAKNYFFRGLASFAIAAKAFDDEAIFQELYEAASVF
ncbi:hypothetical protein [Pseudolabrys sp. FHR47]|uniref:hypothetical protein n=1 Tax=Pseudolabrys sp. FHR47 TaxID=2562284 RepID=UPI0010BF22C9|nr:hypothetical protein [Pseudolabrys sp. FHR47]